MPGQLRACSESVSESESESEEEEDEEEEDEDEERFVAIFIADSHEHYCSKVDSNSPPYSNNVLTKICNAWTVGRKKAKWVQRESS